MNASNHSGQSPEKPHWLLDAGFGLSLLFAVLCVQLLDRSGSAKLTEQGPAAAVADSTVEGEVDTPSLASPAVPSKLSSPASSSRESQPLSRRSEPSANPKMEFSASATQIPDPAPPKAPARVPEKRASIEYVFILDQRPEMDDLRQSMTDNCQALAESLAANGADCRFAVIPFGADSKCIPQVPLTGDLADFKSRLAMPSTEGGEEAAATSSDAIEQALTLDFRKEAQVLFFVISKTPCRNASEIAAAARQMDSRGIRAIVQGEAEEKEHCRSIYHDGRFFSIAGQDLTPSIASTSRDEDPRMRAMNALVERAASLMRPLLPVIETPSVTVPQIANGIYTERTAPDRQQRIIGRGGSPESEAAVQAGLNWLARHQANDGHWSDGQKCEAGGPCQNVTFGVPLADTGLAIFGQSLTLGAPVAETGMAILAFQAGGHYSFNKQKYSENVTRGLDWLVEKQQADGRLFGGQALYGWYEHGIATFALAEACAVAVANKQVPDPRYLDAAKRAIKFIEIHQYNKGGWRYWQDADGLGDTSVSGWQMLALKSAQEAKITVSPKTMTRATQFFAACGDPKTGQTGYQHRGTGTDLTTAVGLIVQEFIVKKPKSPLALKAVKFLRHRADQGIGQTGDFYTLYNSTLAMFLAGGDDWKDWNRHVRDAVVKRQETVGCARGSWNHTYHRTLDTAWAVLTLEVYYRYSTESQK